MKKEFKDNLIKRIKTEKGITLIALVITNIVPYDKMLKCCNL